MTTKLHLLVEARGLPLALYLTGGNVVDCTAFEAVMAKFRLRRPAGGRPGTRPGTLIADKGYSSRKIRLSLMLWLRHAELSDTMPRRIQEQDGRRFRRDVGGSYEGIGMDANIAEHKARQHVRLTLLRGEEPEPTRHRHSEKWHY
nr:transposase [Nonomuraea lactucae]